VISAPWLSTSKVEPPTWVISHMCIEKGYKGILFPSSDRAGGNNLKIFNSSIFASDKLGDI
jgi:hypothetical protein